MPPTDEAGWDEGYPHRHHDDTALTLVHYIDPGDLPTPLYILEDEMMIEVIYPEKDMSVFIPNGIEHGVRKNNGTRNRVAMIATAYQ